MYDAAGQLLSRSLPDGRRLDYVHDGLGRRVRQIAADGSYVEYAWSDLGWLDAVVERQADDTEARRTDLWVDALGELAAIDGAETWWDSASGVPALVSIGGASVFTLPGGATQVGEEWLDPAWRGARATDATDPWGSSRASSVLPGLELPGGASLTATGGLQVGGLEWLGARVYDPAARGFLSVDPLAPVTGAAWAGNPYSYAGNDPMHALDPLGLKPATDADLDAYASANQSVMGHVGDWWGEYGDYVIAGAAIVGGAALMATGVGGPLGIALISGGVDAGFQKLTTGEVNYAQSVGAAALGLVGGIGWTAGRAAMATTTASTKLASSVAVSAGVNGAAGGLGGAGSYFMENGTKWNAREFVGKVGGGTLAGVVSGLATPAAGTLTRAANRSIAQNSGTLTRISEQFVNKTSSYWDDGIGAAAGMSGSYLEDRITGQETTWGDLVFDGAVGAVGNNLPVQGPTNSVSLSQFTHFNPSTLAGTFRGVQAERLWASAGAGMVYGWSTDGLQSGIEEAKRFLE